MKYAEFCAGYGGLGLAVEEVFGAELAWYSEFDPAPSKIMEHHWPTAPNLGDMTKIDYAKAPRVELMSGGTPCQDLSAAGRRAGMTEGTRSNLWVQMREAIAIQKPTYVVWENVRGAYSATAASDLEHCPGCMGDPADRGTVLRALGRVLGDLSDLGYMCEWRGLRAADVGAPHGRFRVFVLAYDPSRVGRDQTLEHDGSGAAADDRASLPHKPDSYTHGFGPIREAASHPTSARHAEGEDGGAGRCHAFQRPWGVEPERDSGERASALTPDASHDGRNRGEEPNGEPEANDQASEYRGHAHGRGLDPERVEAWGHGGAMGETNWGPYEPAIRRWEARLGRPAPRPTEPTGRDNGHRLSPRFTEWMMGLPDGWVTDPAIGISRNEQLKACGNGVVPQQAIAALRDMLAAINNQAPADAGAFSYPKDPS